MTSGFTKEQLQALEDAIAQGILTVHYADRTVSYRSLDELLKIRTLMRRALSLENHLEAQVMSFSKGFDS